MDSTQNERERPNGLAGLFYGLGLADANQPFIRPEKSWIVVRTAYLFPFGFC